MACGTKLACQLWSLCDLIVYCWNAVSFLVKLEGSLLEKRCSSLQEKTIDASLADETAAAFEFFLWDVLCLCYELSFQFNNFPGKQVFCLFLHVKKHHNWFSTSWTCSSLEPLNNFYRSVISDIFGWLVSISTCLPPSHSPSFQPHNCFLCSLPPGV